MTLTVVLLHSLAGSPPVDSPGSSESCFAAMTRRSRAAFVQTVPSFDLCSGSKPGSAKSAPASAARSAKARTERFDAQLARTIDRTRPEVLLAFSDVGSMAALAPLPAARNQNHREHGPWRRARRARACSKEKTRLHPSSCRFTWDRAISTVHSWPGCTSAGCATLRWPIACSFPRTISPKLWCGTERPLDKIRVIPYAADCRRFRPPD